MRRKLMLPPEPRKSYDTHYPRVAKLVPNKSDVAQQKRKEGTEKRNAKVTSYGTTTLDNLRYETVFGERKKRQNPVEVDTSVSILDNGKVPLNRIRYDYLFRDKNTAEKELTSRTYGAVPYYGLASVLLSFKTSRKLGDISKIWPISNKRAWVISVGDTHLTLINQEGKRIHTTPDFDNSIWDFAISSKGKIVLTVDRTSHVHSISPNSEILLAGNFPGYQPYGINITGDGGVLVCIRPLVGTEGPGKLVVINATGEVIRYVEKRDDGSPLFMEPYSVSSIRNGKIFVQDGSTKVVCIDQKGKHFYTWTGQNLNQREELFLPSCLTSDRHGSLIVSSRDANKVYILPVDGKGLRCLADSTNGINSPWGVGVDNEGHLWVCCRDRKIHLIKYHHL